MENIFSPYSRAEHHHPCTSCGEPVPCDGPRCGSIYLPDVELKCAGCVGEEEGGRDAEN